MLPFAVQGHRTAPDGLQSAAVIAMFFGVFAWLAVWTDIPLTEVGLLGVMVVAIAGPVWMSQAMSREAFLPYSYFACRSLLDFGISGLLVLLNMSEIEYGDQFSKAAVL